MIGLAWPDVAEKANHFRLKTRSTGASRKEKTDFGNEKSNSLT